MSWLTVHIGRFIHNALTEAKRAKDREAEQPKVARQEALVSASSSDPLDHPLHQTQFTVVKCANGKLIKVSEYKPHKGPGPDWQHEIYIVKDDEKVPDVIARIMAIKSLEQ